MCIVQSFSVIVFEMTEQCLTPELIHHRLVKIFPSDSKLLNTNYFWGKFTLSVNGGVLFWGRGFKLPTRTISQKSSTSLNWLFMFPNQSCCGLLWMWTPDCDLQLVIKLKTVFLWGFHPTAVMWQHCCWCLLCKQTLSVQSTLFLQYLWCF